MNDSSAALFNGAEASEKAASSAIHHADGEKGSLPVKKARPLFSPTIQRRSGRKRLSEHVGNGGDSRGGGGGGSRGGGGGGSGGGLGHDGMVHSMEGREDSRPSSEKRPRRHPASSAGSASSVGPELSYGSPERRHTNADIRHQTPEMVEGLFGCFAKNSL